MLRIGLIILYAQKPNLSNNMSIATCKVRAPTNTSPQRDPYPTSVNLHDICHTTTPPSNFTHRDRANGFHSLHLPLHTALPRKISARYPLTPTDYLDTAPLRRQEQRYVSKGYVSVHRGSAACATNLLQAKTKLGQIGGGGLRMKENAARCVAEKHQLRFGSRHMISGGRQSWGAPR